jgi:hypothetical protein
LRPTRDGTALAKDVWLAGIGLTLIASSLGARRAARRERVAHRRASKAKTAKSSAG